MRAPTRRRRNEYCHSMNNRIASVDTIKAIVSMVSTPGRRGGGHRTSPVPPKKNGRLWRRPIQQRDRGLGEVMAVSSRFHCSAIKRISRIPPRAPMSIFCLPVCSTNVYQFVTRTANSPALRRRPAFAGHLRPALALRRSSGAGNGAARHPRRPGLHTDHCRPRMR